MFVFIESAAFDHMRPHYLDDDEYGELQQFMMRDPEAGAMVRGSGGGSKTALGARGRGQARRTARDLLRALYAE